MPKPKRSRTRAAAPAPELLPNAQIAAELRKFGSPLTPEQQRKRTVRLMGASARFAVLRDAVSRLGLDIDGGSDAWAIMGLLEILQVAHAEHFDFWLGEFIIGLLVNVAGEGILAVVNDPEFARRRLSESIEEFEADLLDFYQAAERYRDYPLPVELAGEETAPAA